MLLTLCNPSSVASVSSTPLKLMTCLGKLSERKIHLEVFLQPEDSHIHVSTKEIDLEGKPIPSVWSSTKAQSTFSSYRNKRQQCILEARYSATNTFVVLELLKNRDLDTLRVEKNPTFQQNLQCLTVRNLKDYLGFGETKNKPSFTCDPGF